MNKKIYIDFKPTDNSAVYYYDKQNPVPVSDSTGVNSKKFFILEGGTATIETDKAYVKVDANGSITVEHKDPSIMDAVKSKRWF